MAVTITPSGSFVPTTFVVDVAQLQDIEVNSDEFKELLVRLYQNLNLMCISLNAKTSGYYPLNQFVTGNLYYPKGIISTSLIPSNYRSSIRIVIDFGALPNTATKSVPHGIIVTANTTWVVIKGTATDPVGLTGIPIPYASPTGANVIELNVDATNVNVTTNGARSNYTITVIELEFLTQ
jgi:hypothetical protein